MSEVVVVAILSPRKGREADAEALVRSALIEQTHAEAGCVLFALHRDTTQPGRLVLVERWESREALDAHLASAHLAAFRASGADLFDGPAQIAVTEPVPVGDAPKGALAGG